MLARRPMGDEWLVVVTLAFLLGLAGFVGWRMMGG